MSSRIECQFVSMSTMCRANATGGGGAEGPYPPTFCEASSFKAAVKGGKSLAPYFC